MFKLILFFLAQFISSVDIRPVKKVLSNFCSRADSVTSSNVGALTFEHLGETVSANTADDNSCYDAADVDYAAEVLLLTCVGKLVEGLRNDGMF